MLKYILYIFYTDMKIKQGILFFTILCVLFAGTILHCTNQKTPLPALKTTLKNFYNRISGKHTQHFSSLEKNIYQKLRTLEVSPEEITSHFFYEIMANG